MVVLLLDLLRSPSVALGAVLRWLRPRKESIEIPQETPLFRDICLGQEWEKSLILDERTVSLSWASAFEVRFTQERARVWAQNEHEWPRGSSSARRWVPPSLRPGTGTLLGLSFLLPAETLAWAPACWLQHPRQVPRGHKEANFGYWGPGVPWSAPVNVAASLGCTGSPHTCSLQPGQGFLLQS